MELHEYLIILRKRWVSILLITTLAVSGAVAATLLATPTYQAKSQVFVSVRTGGSTSELLHGGSFTQKQVMSYTAAQTQAAQKAGALFFLSKDALKRRLLDDLW